MAASKHARDFNDELARYTGVSRVKTLVMPDLVSGSSLDFVQQVSALSFLPVALRWSQRRTHAATQSNSIPAEYMFFISYGPVMLAKACLAL